MIIHLLKKYTPCDSENNNDLFGDYQLHSIADQQNAPHMIRQSLKKYAGREAGLGEG